MKIFLLKFEDFNTWRRNRAARLCKFKVKSSVEPPMPNNGVEDYTLSKGHNRLVVGTKEMRFLEVSNKQGTRGGRLVILPTFNPGEVGKIQIKLVTKSPWPTVSITNGVLL